MALSLLAANIAYKSDGIQRLDGLKNELGVPIEFRRWPTLNSVQFARE